MYYTNTNGAEAGYVDSGGYSMQSNMDGVTAADYQDSQGYGTVNHSSGGFDNGVDEFHSGAYQQPDVSDPSDFMPEQTNMSFLDRSLISAQESLGSWKSISVRPCNSSSALFSSTTDGSQVGFSEYSTEGELTHLSPSLSTISRGQPAFMPSAGGSSASFSVSRPPRPPAPAGIRTFAPKNPQLQRPSAPLMPRSSTFNMQRPRAPMGPPGSSFDGKHSADEWQTYDSYCGGDEPNYSMGATSGYDQDQDAYRNEAFEPEDTNEHYDNDLTNDAGHTVMGQFTSRGNQGFSGYVGESNPFTNPRGNMANRHGPRFRPRQEFLPRQEAIRQEFQGARMSLPGPNRFPSSGQPLRPRGFGVRPPARLRQPRPPAAFWSLSNANPGSKTGFSSGGVMKSALKAPVRSLMEVPVGPPKPKGPPVSVAENQQQDFSEVSCRELLLCARPPPPPPPVPPQTDVAEESAPKESQKDGIESDEEELDTSQCKLCNMKFEKEQVYHVHIRSTSHLQKLMGGERKPSVDQSPTSSAPPDGNANAPKGPNYCYVCCFDFANSEVYNSHLLGLVHRQKLEAQKKEGAGASTKSKVWDTVTNSRVEGPPSGKTAIPTKTENKIITADDFATIDDFKFVGSAPYTCKICDVQCTGERSYEMHVLGAKHQKNLKKKGEIVPCEKHLDNEQPNDIQNEQRVVRIQAELDRSPEALIGLDYITEYQFDDPGSETCYVCDLCKSKMDPRQVISHVIGVRHRQKYFKFHYEREYWALWNIHRKSEKVRKAGMFAVDCQRREGRKLIRVKVLGSPGDTGAERNIWKEVENDRSLIKAHDRLGCNTIEELNAKYKPVRDDDEDDDEDEPPHPSHSMQPSPPRMGFSKIPAPLHLERPPYNHGPEFPPFHDPYRPGFREGDAFPHPRFSLRPPVYPRPPYYDRPMYDPVSMNHSGLEYRFRYGYDERFDMHRRNIGNDVEHRPAAIRPVVVDYNHGSASSGAASDSKPETVRSSSERGLEYTASLERERRELEDQRLRLAIRLREDEKDREQEYIALRERERRELDDQRLKSDMRLREDEILRSGSYGRERNSLERDIRRPSERDYGIEMADRDRIEHRLDQSVVDSNRQQTRVTMESVGRSASYERDVRQRGEHGRSSLEREQLPTESGRSSSNMETDVNFVRNAIAQCNINTETDAEIALQISNSLTQALLEYRLGALHRMGKSDPDLEQHLNDLRVQNAELDAVDRLDPSRSGSGRMHEALAAAKRLAKTLGCGSGTQELVQMAMSVLDAVNKQLYGMLDTNAPASTEAKSPDREQRTTRAESRRSPDADRHYQEQGKSRRSIEIPDAYRRDHDAAGHSSSDKERFYTSDRDTSVPSTSQSKRGISTEREQRSPPSEDQSATSRSAPSSKRFRFGL